MTPRLTPIEHSDDDRVRAILDQPDVAASDARNVFLTLARHPALLAKWFPFAGRLLTGKLPPRSREILILRAALRWNCEYEWVHHLGVGRAAGLDDADIRRVEVGPGAAGLTHEDAALLSAVDEIYADHTIGEETWATLATVYDERQLLEIPMVIGHYAMLAFVIASAGVQPEHPSERFKSVRAEVLASAPTGATDVTR